MELTLKRQQFNKKWILVPLAIICLVMLVPTAIAFANAINDPTIGMSGVNDSGLTIGMAGLGTSDFLIERGNNGHINPSSEVYPVAIIVPLIFFALALLLIVSMAFGDGLDIKKLIIIALLIMIALALLAGVNYSTNNLFGG